ncbi:MAG: CbbX protein [Streptosporangiaceae bacterium]
MTTPNGGDQSTRPSFGMPGRPAGGEPVAGRGRPAGPPPGNMPINGPDADLPADGTVDLLEARKSSGVDAVLDALDRELVGLVPVKTRIREIAALLLVDAQRARFGLVAARPNLHMCFTGGPGTGKTTVALRMAELLKRLGYSRRGHLVAVTREELVGQYVGHTAPKTREVLKRAMGGVLFIDEAYYLYRAENERDYGQEAIEILLQVMENQREDLVVILAGYKDRMDTFFQSNPGMSSRIAHHIDFPEYSLDELVSIGDLMVAEAGYRLSPAAEATFRDYLARRRAQPRFSNARSVRNALERARLRHAGRVLAGEATAVTRDDLMRLEPEDFLLSRVFTTQPSEPPVGPSGRGADDGKIL